MSTPTSDLPKTTKKCRECEEVLNENMSRSLKNPDRAYYRCCNGTCKLEGNFAGWVDTHKERVGKEEFKKRKANAANMSTDKLLVRILKAQDDIKYYFEAVIANGKLKKEYVDDVPAIVPQSQYQVVPLGGSSAQITSTPDDIEMSAPAFESQLGGSQFVFETPPKKTKQTQSPAPPNLKRQRAESQTKAKASKEKTSKKSRVPEVKKVASVHSDSESSASDTDSF